MSALARLPRSRGDRLRNVEHSQDEESSPDDGSYLISGWMPALEFADLLGIALPMSRPYQTCAGFLLQEFAAIPDVGHKVSVGDWRFEIVDMDGRRIDKVLASRLEKA